MVILRHSLFTLSGRDVMLAGFFTVSSVTVGMLAVIVGVVSALMLAGVAQASTDGTVVRLHVLYRPKEGVFKGGGGGSPAILCLHVCFTILQGPKRRKITVKMTLSRYQRSWIRKITSLTERGKGGVDWGESSVRKAALTDCTVFFTAHPRCLCRFLRGFD